MKAELRCYIFALSAGSVIDKNSNNTSLFELLEQLAVPEEALGQAIPIQAYMGFHVVSGQAEEVEFEARVVRVAQDGTEDAGDSFPFRMGASQRVRIRVPQVRLPKSFGTHILRPEWRVVGDAEWLDGQARWPLILTKLALPTELAPQAGVSPP